MSHFGSSVKSLSCLFVPLQKLHEILLKSYTQTKADPWAMENKVTCQSAVLLTTNGAKTSA